ncbi:4Fe-4S binding protein [bacterium]|nr:4Fe-4S binding protein [bacterium]MBU1613988.1 4Fe-4S binding protein [bacterium]
MSRYEELRQIFRERRCFKLVCGAGNEDAQEVEKLSTVWTLAGATMLDLSANIEVVSAAVRGVEMAYKKAPLLNKEIKIRPYLNVSIGLKGDPHVRKARINNNCAQCGACIPVCGQEAISKDYQVAEFRCIGCGSCQTECRFEAISFIHKKADFANILPECVGLGVETLELHAITDDDEATLADWKLLNEIVCDNFLSICLDRSLLSNKHFMERVKAAQQITGERLIVQADGVPMGGTGDDYNITLQAIACADIVQKSNIPAVVLLSGGTNSKTGLLAKQCGVKANGVAIGTFARKLVKEWIRREDFDTNISVLKEAVERAEELIKVNIEMIADEPADK